MVEIKTKKLNKIEITEGQSVVSNLQTIQNAVSQILKDNLDLRDLKHRHIVRLLVEDKLGRKVSDESVPRAIREIQNTQGRFNPEKEDDRKELAQAHKEFYSK